jgi:hypothetical protein
MYEGLYRVVAQRSLRGRARDVPSVDREVNALLNREAWLLLQQKTQWPMKDKELAKLDDNFF